MYKAREVNEAEHPDFYRMVKRLVLQANMPMPRVYIIPSEGPNAFATGRNPENAVAATEGIMRLLTTEELEGVMADELAHVQNRDTLIGTVAATFAGAIAMLGNMLQWAAIFGGGDQDDEEGGSMLGSLALAFIAPMVAMVLQMGVAFPRIPGRCSRRPDLRQASCPGQCTAQTSDGSASRSLHEARPSTAHMFIVNPLTSASMLKLFSTHPPVEERIARLEALAQGHG